MDSDRILEVENLQTAYYVGKRRVHAVNGVSFELRRGETLGIVGESGCGKSATAHSILQLLARNGKIEGGRVLYYPEQGEPMDLSRCRRNGKTMRAVRGKEISMIFQDPLSSLNPVYTVGSQIVEMMRAHEKIGKKQAAERAIELLAKLGIPDPQKRFQEYPHQFSGGMKQRVMIAIAMICNPRLLIADEPTTALDVTIQAQILDLMREIQREYGTSIMLITHNMGIVAELCDRVAVMYMGRIVEYGTLEQVFTRPQHPYTIALMQSVPVLGMGRDRRLTAIEGATPDGSTVFQGCAFADRCPKAQPQCFEQPPVDRTVEPGHRTCCHFCGEGGAAE